MVREFLKRGASVDLQTSLGVTALMDAAYYNHLSIVLVLLQHSANPDLQNIDGATALMAAAGKGHGLHTRHETLDRDTGHTAKNRGCRT